MSEQAKALFAVVHIRTYRQVYYYYVVLECTDEMNAWVLKFARYGTKIKKISHLLALGVKDPKSSFGVNRAGEKEAEYRNDARNDGKFHISNNHGVSTNSMLQFGFDLLRGRLSRKKSDLWD